MAIINLGDKKKETAVVIKNSSLGRTLQKAFERMKEEKIELEMNAEGFFGQG